MAQSTLGGTYQRIAVVGAMNNPAITNWSLDSASGVPLHHQLEQVIRVAIVSGVWKPGQLICSEREFTALAGVSRATVRQALTSLTYQGILERIHGRGTFVARPKLEQEIRAVYSFSEQVRANGLELEDRIIQRKIIAAPPDLAEMLTMPVGAKLIHLQRLRLLDGIPFMVNSSYIAQALCPGLLSDNLGPSLYRLLTEKYGLPPLRAKDTLESIGADPLMAAHLQVPIGAPLTYIERLAYTRDDKPLHVGRNHIRGDLCRFRIDLQSQPTLIEVKASGTPILKEQG